MTLRAARKLGLDSIFPRQPGQSRRANGEMEPDPDFREKESDLHCRLTTLSHGGGCGCKIAPGVRASILGDGARGLVPPALLVGIETSDDAAVYRLNERQAIVA